MVIKARDADRLNEENESFRKYVYYNLKKMLEMELIHITRFEGYNKLRNVSIKMPVASLPHRCRKRERKLEDEIRQASEDPKLRRGSSSSKDLDKKSGGGGGGGGGGGRKESVSADLEEPPTTSITPGTPFFTFVSQYHMLDCI